MGKSEHLYDLFWENHNARVIDCKSCGFKHLDPIPSEQILSEFYTNQYYQQVKPFEYKSVDEVYVRNKTKDILESVPYNHIYSKVVESLSDDQPLRMLDVGSGNDLLSAFFNAKGWESHSIEPNHEAVEYLRKFNVSVFPQFLDDESGFPVSGLSFVNIQFVLEHLRNPRLIMQKAREALNPGGILRIVVPNDFSDVQMSFKQFYDEEYRWIQYPDHINYFDFNSLERFISDFGFKEVYRTTSFPVDFLLLSGLNYHTNKDEQAKVGTIISNFEKSFIETGRKELLEQLYNSLAKLGLGRSVTIYAIKE